MGDGMHSTHPTPYHSQDCSLVVTLLAFCCQNSYHILLSDNYLKKTELPLNLGKQDVSQSIVRKRQLLALFPQIRALTSPAAAC